MYTSTPTKSTQNQLTSIASPAKLMPTTITTTSPTNGISGDLADRGREKKRTTIFGTLRKRLSRSKTRNGSAERDVGNATPTNGFADSRSVSADRLNNQQQTPIQKQPLQSALKPGLKPLPLQSPQQTQSQSKYLASPSGVSLGIQNLSRHSSMSETSGISGLSSASNKTFLHEASSLVLEVIENGVKR